MKLFYFELYMFHRLERFLNNRLLLYYQVFENNYIELQVYPVIWRISDHVHQEQDRATMRIDIKSLNLLTHFSIRCSNKYNSECSTFSRMFRKQ